MGDGVLAAAAPLLAASLTKDPFLVGLVSAAGYAAWLLVGLPSGALVDRSALRPVMIAADTVRAVSLAVLLLAMTTRHASIWLLSAAVFTLGVGSCFFDPAAQAMIPMSAGREPAQLRRLNGWYWAVDTFGRSLVGPPLGAWAFASSARLPFLADALSFAVSASLVTRLPRRPRADRTKPEITVAIHQGVQALWRQRQLRIAAMGMGAYNFGWSIANATLVLFATRALKLSEREFGLVLAAAAVGGIGGGWAHHLLGDAEIGRVYALVLLLQAGAWGLVAATGNPAVLFAAVLIVGFANTTISTAGAATRQHHAPSELLGRVYAGTRVIGVGANCLGSVVGGALARSWDLVAPFTVSSAVLLASAAWFALKGTPERAPGDAGVGP